MGGGSFQVLEAQAKPALGLDIRDDLRDDLGHRLAR